MRWQLGRRSDNVEDARGAGRGLGLGGLSGGMILVVAVASYFLGVNPMDMIGALVQLQGDLPVESRNPAPPGNDEGVDFVRAIVGDTEDTWGQIFQAGGVQYEPPSLVLFSGMVRSGCGGASAASGPFYCPADRKVYLDLSFFDEMRHLGGGGDFAQAYVISHEIGHHVQKLLGLTKDVENERSMGGSVEGAGGLLVRQELQADCFSGVWAYHAQKRHQWLDPGDAEKALATAAAIGDDRLQRRTQGAIVPDAFTHGSSQQRVRWFSRGFESGDVNQCDTFGASQL